MNWFWWCMLFLLCVSAALALVKTFTQSEISWWVVLAPAAVVFVVVWFFILFVSNFLGAMLAPKGRYR